MFKKPLSRVLGGSGTHADPFVVISDIAFELDRIPMGGYDYELGRIAKVRELFEQTEMTDEQRARFAERIDTKELRCRALRPQYLLRRSEEVKRFSLEKAEAFRKRAKEAYVDFKRFANEHPGLTADHLLNAHWCIIFQPIQELE